MGVTKNLKPMKKLYTASELGELLLYTIYNAKAIWKVCKLDAKTVRKLRNDLKEDFAGFSLTLHSDYMVHFLNRHFYEKQPDHRSITWADLEHIGDVVNGYKTAEEGNRDNTIVFSKYAGSGVFELVVEINREEKRLEGRSFRIMRH